MRVRFLSILAAASLALTLGPRPVAAFCLHEYTGFKAHAKWKQMPVGYKVSANLTDPALLAAIDKAFATWSQVACGSLTFKNDGTFDIAQSDFKTHGYEGIYVFWYTEAEKAEFPTDAKFFAFNFSGHDNDGGIAVASVAINAFAFKWNASGGDVAGLILDVQNEMVYLIGSVLGLADSTAADSVMKPGGQYGSTDRHTLKKDDEDAVVHLYPKDDTCQAPAPASDCGGATTPPADGGGTTPVGDGGGTTPGADGGGTTPTGDGGGTTTPPGPESDGGGTTPPGADGGGVAAGDGAGVDTGADDGGCSCEVGAPAGASASIVLALLAIALFRQRRRQ